MRALTLRNRAAYLAELEACAADGSRLATETLKAERLRLAEEADLRKRWRELLALGPAFTVDRRGRGGPAVAALELARAERVARAEGWWYGWQPDAEASYEEGEPRFTLTLFGPDDAEGEMPFASLGGLWQREGSPEARLAEAELAAGYLEERREVAGTALAEAARACRQASASLEPSAGELDAYDALEEAAARLLLLAHNGYGLPLAEGVVA